MKKTEKLYKEKLIKYRTDYMELADNITDLFFTMDENLNYIYWNKASSVFLNLSLKEVVGKNIYDIFPNFKNTDIEEVYLDVLKTKKNKNIKTFFNINNKQYFFDIRVYPIKKGLAVLAKDITKEKLAQDALNKIEEIYCEFYEKSPLGYQSLDANGNILIINDTWLELLGYEKEEVIGKWIGDFLTPEYKEIFSLNFSQFKSIGKIHSEFKMICKNKDIKYLNFDGKIVYNPDGSLKQTHCILYDITERKKIEERLKQQTDAMEATVDGIAILNKEEKYVYLNEAHVKIYGYGSPMELIGKSWSILYDCDELQRFGNDILPKFRGKGHWQGEAIGMKKDGSKFFQEVSLTALHDGGLICIARDITERKKLEEEILYLGYHDQLTGLYNRRFFEEETKRLDSSRQLPLSIIMADLNGLKLTNDTFGHSEGDIILKETAMILKRVCRSEDILARWGGDEFIILLPRTSITDSEEIAERIKKECSKKTNQKIPLSLSIGVATKIEAGQDIQAVIIDAEDNMYKNKLFEKQSISSSILTAFKQSLYEKSNETIEQTNRVINLAMKLGKSIKLHSSQLDDLCLLASLHNIGKVAIPENILMKEDKLTEKEWKIIKRHPEIGFNIARSFPQIAHIAKFILSCHENWDGSGYPQGLKGEEIPIISRIIFIIDIYETMVSGRIYKKPKSKIEAIKELKRCAGTQFNPELVNKFIEII
ncbi:MAG: PAS domain S-box protein [Actinobacteria bacterium]|nr:PAS domain S-box protein [Actinomycetota bacterium]